MSKTALRLTVVSALAFILFLGLGILPALAMASIDLGGPGESVTVKQASGTSNAKAAGTKIAAPAVVASSAPAANSTAKNVVAAPVETHRDNEVEFAGTIQSIAGSLWTVNGISFTVNISTEIYPSASLAIVGAFVKVEAIKLDDGSLVAKEIEVVRPEGERERHVEFRGMIESFNASVWVVAGRTVNISPTTVIRGTPVVSATAEVEALLKADGSLWALKIEVERRETEKERVEFRGVISAFSATQWVVGGRTVLISTTTQISGTPQIGLIAEVYALKSGSTLTALRIRVVKPEPKEVEFSGKITSMAAGSWVVDGKTINIDASTQIDQSRGVAKVGARVEVEGLLQADGSVNAKRIRVVGGH